MFCQSCGKQIPPTVRFCEACGQPVAGAAAVPAGETQYAGFWLRFVAYIIDYAIVLIGALIVGMILGLGLAAGGVEVSERDLENVEAVGNLIGVVVFLLYFALMESSSWQATLGKKALSLKVTDSGGNRISFGRALGRNAAKILSALILLIGYLMAGFTEKKQALHDMIAGCLVVKKA
ncbi:MAG: RDD family protein [Terriglobia bacterium]